MGPNAFQLDIDAFAREWNLSRRTLQRKLANQGLEWSRVVERIRFEHAIDRLTVPDLTLIELALGLGYSDQANFGRAFRKWTGISPGSWRRVRRSRQT